ncbi:MAG: ABC transporter permease [Gammaproteobacteria bacterium]|nr:MAG: ABC transporter permease [Gammaproteobacteria bacterium]
MSPYFEYQREPDALTISLKDDWTFSNVKELDDALHDVQGNGARQITFQCGGLQNIDLAGAWVLFRRSQEFESEGRETQFLGFKAAHFKFLQNITDIRDSAVAAQSAEPVMSPESDRLRQMLETVGRAAAAGIEDVGRIAHAVLSGVSHPSRLALDETIRQIEHTGARAVPIVMLITFFMGIVLAYQGANQLAEFGAEIFVADLVTVSMLREMGVLLAAIMAAGRSGSAFAASIGVMKLNEEIDALRVMGLNPNHVLVAPRVLGLLISLPFLAVFGMLAGMVGGMALSVLALDMSAVQYIERTAASATIQDFLVGLVKAPVFALLIAGVSTLRGMQVSGSAEQLGRLTTTAVVQAVFLVVFADAIFTVVFSRLGI